MEDKRLLDVLDKQLAYNPYVAGEEYSIADMEIWRYGHSLATWCWEINAAEFLDAGSYQNV